MPRRSGVNPLSAKWATLGILASLALAFVFPAASPLQADRTCCPPSGGGATLAPGIQGMASAFDPAQYRGKVLIVNFMAEWCPGCWSELPGLVRLSWKYKDRGLAVVGISVGSLREGTLKLIQQFGIAYPVYLDPEGRVAVERFRLTGMPSTFIYDKNGKLVRSLRGGVSEPVLKTIVAALL
ncbi:TlpA disulfide reductase family protein [Thermus altitudinis]|uniref:TlpA family protein disulfide reductase n=1 Tax=Thermus altitudinis TaxID=2908145 RepID=UPI00311AB546